MGNVQINHYFLSLSYAAILNYLSHHRFHYKPEALTGALKKFMKVMELSFIELPSFNG